MHSVHVPKLSSFVDDALHEGLKLRVDLIHLVDGDVLEVDGDGGLGVEEDVGVDVRGQRLGQLDEVLLKRADWR